jgi:hypothetical protein
MSTDEGYRCDSCLSLLTQDRLGFGICSRCEDAASEPPDWYFEDGP